MKLDDLEALIESATKQAFRDKLGHLIENEEERALQKKTSEDIEGLKSNKKAKDLDEAEDEESDKEEEPSAKAALGKEEPPEGEGDSPNAVMPSADDMAEADISQIINMLNMLRSGKSTKDEAVKDQLTKYFDSLPPGDRQALFVLLSGLTQILTSGIGGDTAPAPSKVGIKIRAKQKQKDDEDAEERIRSQAKADAGAEGEEETAEMKPILVGESQNKSWIYKILERNRS